LNSGSLRANGLQERRESTSCEERHIVAIIKLLHGMYENFQCTHAALCIRRT
jgi:hypothetical protein